MGKAAGGSGCGRTGGLAGAFIGSSAGKGGYSGSKAQVFSRYNFGRIPNFMSSMTDYTGLFKRWEEMQKQMGKGTKYELRERRAQPYERMGPLEVAANLAMAADSVDYGGKRALYSINTARGAGKGYGMPVRGDSYTVPNIINFAAQLDRAYKPVAGKEGYQPNFDYSCAA